MELKVGDYVRLKRCQGINRIEEYDEDIKKYILEDFIGDEWGEETYILDENDVIKSSPNIIDLIEVDIIDLIEVGDYVDGHKVIYTIGDFHKKVYVEYVNMNELLEIKLEQIKSIVTKEQFESMEYKV